MTLTSYNIDENIANCRAMLYKIGNWMKYMSEICLYYSNEDNDFMRECRNFRDDELKKLYDNMPPLPDETAQEWSNENISRFMKLCKKIFRQYLSDDFDDICEYWNNRKLQLPDKGMLMQCTGDLQQWMEFIESCNLLSEFIESCDHVAVLSGSEQKFNIVVKDWYKHIKRKKSFFREGAHLTDKDVLY